ncbi:DUF2690 domain-containing protein [Streptomyces sp. NPDC056304]|uniref:DUF2690 domain-containing protein n=1 Tax=Streptomyces sp. NPDC056304 TaxID=3345778 RepID=UPI0035DE16C0
MLNRRLMVRFSCAAMLFGTLAVTAPAAHASATGSCYGSSCTGKEPNGTTCASDAITAKQVTSGGRTIQLRYSPSCRAAWGKITGASVGDWITVDNGSAYEERQVNSGSDQHTVMVNDAGVTSSACGFKNGTTLLACTGSY